MKYCSIDECLRRARSRGLCKKHYERWRRSNIPASAQHQCSVERCEKTARNCGLCGMHYARLRKHGTTEPIVRPPKPRQTCSVEDCTNELTRNDAKGLCSKHYQRLRKRGTVDDPVRIPWPEHCVFPGCDGQVAVKELSLCWRHYQHHWQGRLGQVREKETHGLHRSPEYASWQHMRNRCLNKKCESYHDYGGRGITVCKRWRSSFIAFYEDMGKKPDPTLSINRIDNDGNYSCGHCEECVANGWPANCEWADDLTQRLNQRMRKNNKSGYKNVNWDKVRSMWVVRVKRHAKYVFGGRFKSLQEAAAARDNFLLNYEHGDRKLRGPTTQPKKSA